MKNTGMIRRIDELGRIVIPKEIRATFGLKTGSALQISVCDDSIVLTCYDVLQPLGSRMQELTDLLSAITNKPYAICNCDKVIAISRLSNKVLGTKLHKNTKEFIKTSTDYSKKFIKILDFTDTLNNVYIWPFFDDKSCQGAIVVVNDSVNEQDVALANFTAQYLHQQLE